ncbi:MAG TPA: 4a-hydroxytetrahydrobiopterin dehydratase [Ktedonobacterales bacterium]|nr:4a-hydroxytetrahydrobiopterin dehydratase [Ktedonobacterales bacterium]
MDTDLRHEHCVACHPGQPALTDTELREIGARLPGWRVEPVDGIPHLTRTFAFPDFAAALAFTNRVGALAEAEGHHPALLTEWGKVTVSWWTHAIGGLHHNDVVMAAKTDEAYGGAQAI